MGNPFTINAHLQVCRKYLQFFMQHFCHIHQKVKELSGSVTIRALKLFCTEGVCGLSF